MLVVFCEYSHTRQKTFTPYPFSQLLFPSTGHPPLGAHRLLLLSGPGKLKENSPQLLYQQYSIHQISTFKNINIPTPPQKKKTNKQTNKQTPWVLHPFFGRPWKDLILAIQNITSGSPLPNGTATCFPSPGNSHDHLAIGLLPTPSGFKSCCFRCNF